ncbi:MAG: hypothetical protein LBM13_02885, partial [Candidatus Ancillula sp.]|nr:hypothetical protein [Candidatus Ancillula sp.]
MYLKRIKNKNGDIYLTAVESYRTDGKVKQRTVKNYGNLKKLLTKNPDALEVIQKEIEDLNNQPKKNHQLTVTFDLDKTSPENTIKYIAPMILESLYDDLGISDAIKTYCKLNDTKFPFLEILKAVQADLLFMPENWLTDENTPLNYYENWHITLDQWKYFQDNFYKLILPIRANIEKILDPVFKNEDIIFAITYRTFSNGITNFSNQIDPSNLNHYSKMRKGSEFESSPSLVKLGLLATNSGICIASHISIDNSTSTQIYDQEILNRLQRHNVKTMTVFGTQYLYNPQNLMQILNHKDNYVFIRTLAISPRDFEDFLKQAISSEGWKYTPDRHYAKKSFLRTKRLANGFSYQEKILLIWSQERANIFTEARFGIKMFTNGMIHSEKYAFSYDKRKAQTRDEAIFTGEEFDKIFSEQKVRNLQTNEEEILNPYLDSKTK